jgi:hypothetical protein
MCSIVFQTVPLCSHIQGFSFCSVPSSSVSFHRTAAMIVATEIKGTVERVDDSTRPLDMDLSYA